MLARLLIAVISILIVLSPTTPSIGSQCMPMSFKGKLSWDPLKGDPRNVKLGHNFTFFDSACREWRAPKGHIVDGTSIPSILWTITGRTPFTGLHRRASAIHDVYFDLKTRPAHETHYAFYEALLADKVGETEALIMYLAVTAYAPRWIVNKSFVCPPNYRCANDLKRNYKILVVTPQIDASAIQGAVQKINAGKLSREAVRDLGDDIFFGTQTFKQEGIMVIELSDAPVTISRNADINMSIEFLLREQREDGDVALRKLIRRN